MQEPAVAPKTCRPPVADSADASSGRGPPGATGHPDVACVRTAGLADPTVVNLSSSTTVDVGNRIGDVALRDLHRRIAANATSGSRGDLNRATSDMDLAGDERDQSFSVPAWSQGGEAVDLGVARQERMIRTNLM